MVEICVVSNSLYVFLSLFSIVSASRSWIYMVSEVVVLEPEIQKKNHFSEERKYGKKVLLLQILLEEIFVVVVFTFSFNT